MRGPVADDGRDTRVALSGGWLWRGPRHRRAEERLRAEADFLGWLAPQVPLAVPLPELFSATPLRLRHRPIMGDRWTPGVDDAAEGEAFGAFLATLHALPTDEAVTAGARDAEELTVEQQRLRERWSTEVVPRLPRPVQATALAVLMRQIDAGDVDATLVHGDVRAEHVLRGDRGLVGVIDWLDAGIGDPAMDLAWPLYGTTPQFVEGFRAACPVRPDLEARALGHHRLRGMRAVLDALDHADAAAARRALTSLERRLHGRGESVGETESEDRGRRR